jgi:hypothetical protein
MTNLIKLLTKNITPNSIICGDLNLPKVNWNTSITTDKISASFLDFVLNFQYKQLISEPTHIEGSILDLLLSNSAGLIQNQKVSSGLSTSDHFSIQFSINSLKPKPESILIKDTSKIPLLASTLASLDYSFLNNHFTIDKKYSILTDVLTFFINIHIPTKAISKNANKNKYPPHIRSILKQKLALFHQLKSDRSLVNEYRNICKTSRSLIKSLHSNKIKNIVSNPHKLFNFVRSSTKSNEPIPAIQNNGTYVSSNQDKCEIFASLFAKSFCNIPKTTPPTPFSVSSHSLEDVVFDIPTISYYLKACPLS